MDFDFVEKNRISYLIFKEGEFFGEVEQVADTWVFHPRSGLAGDRYAFGCCPLDALEQWCSRNMKGE